MFGFESFEQRRYGEEVEQRVEDANVGYRVGVQTEGCIERCN